MNYAILFLSIAVVLIIVALLLYFFVIAKMIARNQCINNLQDIFSISENDAKCFYDDLFKYNVSKSTIDKLCKYINNETDFNDFIQNLSANDVKGIKQSFIDCSINH